MDLYFRPLACSAATRIAFYEAGKSANYVYVNKETNRTDRGEDYAALNPHGQVPTLRLDDGTLLTENGAILRHLSDVLTPGKSASENARLMQWIGFVNSEIHTGAFSTILDTAASDETKAYALAKAAKRFAFLDKHLAANEYLTGKSYSVADGYLAVVLNWTRVRGPDLAAYPHLSAYRTRIMERSSVKKAMSEEMALYQAEQKARAA